MGRTIAAAISSRMVVTWVTLVGLTGAAEPPLTAAEPIRIATFNVSLYGKHAGEVLERLNRGDDTQARHLAEIIQRVRPQILLINEIDYDAQGAVVRAFVERYLQVAQHVSGSPLGPAEPIDYPHRFTASVNTGRHSGFDLDRNGSQNPDPGGEAYAADCWGFGLYEGQYGMAVLSMAPIDAPAVRTFRNFRWRDMPGAKLPDDSATPERTDWYPAEGLNDFPLSSKSHWDVPILVGGQRLHLLCSHPTPPVYDGAEDRNGRRNQDEIRFWADYIGPAAESSYIYDDKGGRGGLNADFKRDAAARPAGLKPSASGLQPHFVIVGDLNSDPEDGDGQASIGQLLTSDEVLQYPAPQSLGGAEQARLQRGANERHRGDPACDTCDPADKPGPGNLRIDYVLPSQGLAVKDAGVFWPAADDPLFSLVGVHPFPSSDHRLVWADVTFTNLERDDGDSPSAAASRAP